MRKDYRGREEGGDGWQLIKWEWTKGQRGKGRRDNSNDTCECDRGVRKVEKAKRPEQHCRGLEKIWAIRKCWG